MNYYDPEIYDSKNLKFGDKQTLEFLFRMQEKVFDKTAINEYVSENYNGRVTSAIVKELLTGFVDFLNLQMDYCINDFIIDTIESYDEAETN